MTHRHWQGSTLLATVLVLTLATSAGAAQAPVGLGTAGSFAVLGGSTVTNTGPSVVNGDLGLSPGTAVTGFPPGTVNGTIHATNAVAGQAQSDTTTAYNDAAGRIPAATVSADLGGQVLSPGVYKSASSLGLTGDVTLDAQGNPSSVFIFQAGSTLTTASSSRVVLTNGADACNVFWQVGSSATLGTNSSFKGTILALTAISLTTGATVDGRMLARNAAVTMDTNTITRGTCASSTPTPDTPGAGTPTGTIPIGVGTAILTPVPRQADICREGFRARVTGLRIKQVVFTLDGRTLATRTRSPFSVSVPSQSGGSHRLRARVTFTDATRAATLTLRYRACAAATRRVPRVPRFTG